MKADFGSQANNPLVSVIIPVYNVQPYIETCVESIVSQDYENIEIILVDDGSSDGSGQTLDEFAASDSRIHVIHQQNAGVSFARNAGLSLAKGEYIAFIDADDYVEPDYISYFVDLIRKNDCEMAVGKNHFTSFNKRQISVDHQELKSPEYVIEGIYLAWINEAVWNKLYKRSFIQENNFSFDTSIWYGEGMLFNITCLQFVNKVAVGEKKLYHQVFNPNSAMRKFSLESNYCGIRSLEVQKSRWIRKNDRIEKAWDYHYRCFSNSILCGLVKSDMVEEHRDVYERCIKNLRTNLKLALQVDIPIKRKVYYVVAYFCPVLLAKRNAWKDRRAKLRIEKEWENAGKSGI